MGARDAAGQILDKSRVASEQAVSNSAASGRIPTAYWLTALLGLTGMALSRRRIASHQPIPDEDLLPPPPRAKQRPKQDRGLPADEVIADLAREYLEWQRRLWPKLVQSGLLPEPTDETLREMVEDFKARDRGAKVSVEAIKQFITAGVALLGDYGRYSCDGIRQKLLIC